MSTSLIPSTYENQFRIVPNWTNFRAYGFRIVVYQEWSHIDETMRRIMNLPCKYFGISPIHDKDFLENGKPDKPHYHVILRFPNARSAHQLTSKKIIPCNLMSRTSIRKT